MQKKNYFWRSTKVTKNNLIMIVYLFSGARKTMKISYFRRLGKLWNIRISLFSTVWSEIAENKFGRRKWVCLLK
jgi:hypothetical protein